MRGTTAKVGDKIRIVAVDPAHFHDDDCVGKEGYVTMVDEYGDLYGTWGVCRIIVGVDDFIVL